MAAFSLVEVNKMEFEKFSEIFGNVVEHCALCSSAAWDSRPFESLMHFHGVICQFLDDLPLSGKAGILRLHPKLGKRISKQELTDESKMEQMVAGIASMEEREANELERLNLEYEKQMQVPFVICAKLNNTEKILIELKRRLKNPVNDEILTGIEEYTIAKVLIGKDPVTAMRTGRIKLKNTQ